MGASRTTFLVGLLIVTGLLLAGWTLYEARIQQREIERELATQAVVVARSLGPGLTAASNAAREIDEVVVWKLLDNARLLAELGIANPNPDELAKLAELNGLDTVAYLDSAARSELVVGEDPLAETRRQVVAAVSGPGDEVILDPIFEDGVEHLAVAVSRPGGGVVLVQIHALEARAFTRRLGVENLLDRLAGSDGILYLGYREEPGDHSFVAVWDDGELPGPMPTGERLRTVRGRQVFEVEVPLESPAGSTASLRVGLDGEPLLRAAASAMRRSVLIGTVLAAFALLVAAFALLSRLRGRERLEAARRLAEAEAARRRSERLAAAGALTAGLAHEVRSPMNAIGLAAQRLERKLPENDDRRPMVQRIRAEVKRLEGVLREFLDLARPVSDLRETTDLGEMAREVVELLRTEAEAGGITLETPTGAAKAAVDPAAVRSSLINLVRNALQASRSGDRVSLVLDESSTRATVTVLDEGSGIDADIADRVFDAFVTSRASGTGLGLALVKRVAEEHGGSITLTDRRSKGTAARLSLPRQEGL